MRLCRGMGDWVGDVDDDDDHSDDELYQFLVCNIGNQSVVHTVERCKSFFCYSRVPSAAHRESENSAFAHES